MCTLYLYLESRGFLFEDFWLDQCEQKREGEGEGGRGGRKGEREGRKIEVGKGEKMVSNLSNIIF